eukprot:2534515-Lingulodinium_polyedra.AAC.1
MCRDAPYASLPQAVAVGGAQRPAGGFQASDRAATRRRVARAAAGSICVLRPGLWRGSVTHVRAGSIAVPTAFCYR